MSSPPTAPSPLTRARAKDAVDYVIGMVFKFMPVDMHPICNALVILTGKEDDLSICESGLNCQRVKSIYYCIRVITTSCFYYHKDT